MHEIKIPEPRKYSSFTTQKDFSNYFGAAVRERLFTPGKEALDVQPDDALQVMIDKALRIPLRTEKIVSEGLIFPVLIETINRFLDRVSFFSGVEWKTEEGAPYVLSGFCDFMIGGLPDRGVPEAPMICVVVPKREDFETGAWQCAAELYACKINNDAAGIRYPFYFGCVTVGREWNFIRLDCEANILFRDSFFYTLENLPRLLGVWSWVIETQLASALEKKSD